MATVILISLVVFILLAEHYFPHWQEWTGKKLPDPARLVLNYVAGTLAWFGPFTVWLVVEGFGKAALIGWAFVVTGGLTVALAYRYDHLIEERRRLREVEEENELLRKQRQDAEGEGIRQAGERKA